MAPEIVADVSYDWLVDNWAIGILIYEMIKGTTPFLANTCDEIYDLILQNEVDWTGLGSAETLIKGLLNPNVAHWLSLKEALKHDFFSDLNMGELYLREIPAPYLPKAKVVTKLKRR